MNHNEANQRLLSDLASVTVCAGLDDAELARIAANGTLHELSAADRLEPEPQDEHCDLHVVLVFTGQLAMIGPVAIGSPDAHTLPWARQLAAALQLDENVATEDRIWGYVNARDSVGYSHGLQAQFGGATSVQAEQDSRVLVLRGESLMSLLKDVPRFREHLLRTMSERMARLFHKVAESDPRWLGLPIVVDRAATKYSANVAAQTAGSKTRRAGMAREINSNRIVAVVATTARCQPIAKLLAKELESREESVTVVEDRQGEDRQSLSQRDTDRVIVQVNAWNPKALDDSSLSQLVGHCDHVLWCCDNQQPNREMEGLLVNAVKANVELRSQVTSVQLLKRDTCVGRKQRCCPQLKRRDFMVPDDSSGQANGVGSKANAVRRIARFLRGTTTGLALGGGGARGMSHPGVLRTFDAAGIDFDMMSGTSVGSMVGLGYASGITPQTLIETFEEQLKPNEVLDMIPGGRRLFLLGNFQLRSWEGMLRKYYHDWTFDQLSIPFAVVTTDLISGREVVRETGDIVTAILESINVPILTRPILRDGQMLVDGGVVNNLPADVLKARSVNVVVGVDVTKEIPSRFNGATSQTPKEEIDMPNRFETAYRVMDISRQASSQLQLRAADFVIEPDTREFDFADFAEATALAKVGEQATKTVLPQIQAAWKTF